VTILTGYSWRREEAEKDRITLAWYVAGFHRAKRLPDLDLLLSGGELPEQSPMDMLAVLRSFQEAGIEMSIERMEAPPWGSALQ
jgi:hypothetical protein